MKEDELRWKMACEIATAVRDGCVAEGLGPADGTAVLLAALGLVAGQQSSLPLEDHLRIIFERAEIRDLFCEAFREGRVTRGN